MTLGCQPLLAYEEEVIPHRQYAISVIELEFQSQTVKLKWGSWNFV